VSGPATGCATDEELVALLEGALSADAAARLDVHIDGCPACATAVTDLARLVAGELRTVGRFRLEAPLGVGGMGVVWAAWDPDLERHVAVKRIRPDVAAEPTARARLLGEARAMARLTHPNVVAVYEVGEADGDVFLATELIEGATIARWQRGRPGPEVVAAYAQAARGLAAAHAAGLVHRDVKPANLLVGNDGRVRVGDFGLARRGPAPAGPPAAPAATADPRVTQVGAIVGTPAYLAPEQRAGAAADARADQYSLCVALAEALTGARPRAGQTAADLTAAGAPPAVAGVLARGLAADPEARFGAMAELADALDASRRAELTPATRPRRWPSARSIALAAAATLLALAGVLGLRPSGRPRGVGPASSARALPDAGDDPLERAAQLRIERNGHACLRALAAAAARPRPRDDPRDRERLEREGWRCQMLAGDCAGGQARAERFLSARGMPAAAAAIEADSFCSVGEGDRATRARRLYTQVIGEAAHRVVGCEPYAQAALALAGAPGLAADAQAGPMVVGVLGTLAECFAAAGRCDRARALVAEAAAAGLPVPWSDLACR
jgi:hypothetical protein